MECDPNKLSLNGNLEEGDGQTKYWDVWGGDTSITTVTPGFGGSGYAIKSFARPHYSHGQAQILNMLEDFGVFDDLEPYNLEL